MSKLKGAGSKKYGIPSFFFGIGIGVGIVGMYLLSKIILTSDFGMGYQLYYGPVPLGLLLTLL